MTTRTNSETEVVESPMKSQRICSTKAILMDAYHRLRAAHTDALARFRRHGGNISQANDVAAYAEADELRQVTVLAQQKLEEHVAAHGC